jgi:UDP-3-O-[3-hydroxymyristoyl] glucosamine N-acyltransferase
MDKALTVAELAAMVDGEVVGDGRVVIRGFAPLETAGPEDLSFLAKGGKADRLADCRAGAVLVPLAFTATCPAALIRVGDPYLASAIIHTFFLDRPFVAKGVHPRAWVGEECRLGEAVSIAPLAVLGDRVSLGERVTIEAGAVVGDGVQIGDDSTIHANVTIYPGCTIGSRVRIHAGAVIGSDGYGYATNQRGEHLKRPQTGTVKIDDDVEIGAGSCIDRGAYGVTRIGEGTKIDNLVQIGHNVQIGPHCLVVAQVGIAGSTRLGRNVVMGGQSASAGHLTIGDQTMVAARGGVHTDLAAKSMVGGAPALPIRHWAKCSAVFARLPELQSMVRKHDKALSGLGTQENKEKK